jgi:hypothetical protein
MYQVKIFTGAGGGWPENIENKVNEFLSANPRIIIYEMVHTQHVEGSSITLLYNNNLVKKKTKSKED